MGLTERDNLLAEKQRCLVPLRDAPEVTQLGGQGASWGQRWRLAPEPVLLIRVWIPISKRVCGEGGEQLVGGVRRAVWEIQESGRR